MASYATDGRGPGNILHRGRQDQEYIDHPPIMRLNYNYKFDFTTMAMAYMHKYTWEPKWTLTTVAGIEHADDDQLVYIRRHEAANTDGICFERVVINRKNNTMIAQNLL